MTKDEGRRSKGQGQNPKSQIPTTNHQQPATSYQPPAASSDSLKDFRKLIQSSRLTLLATRTEGREKIWNHISITHP
jgi:hypothetical protein